LHHHRVPQNLQNIKQLKVFREKLCENYILHIFFCNWINRTSLNLFFHPFKVAKRNIVVIAPYCRQHLFTVKSTLISARQSQLHHTTHFRKNNLAFFFIEK
jgi:hypothetical protein